MQAAESEIHFRLSQPETLDNPENPKISGLFGVSSAGWQKWSKWTLNLNSILR